MRTIWKYNVPITDNPTFTAPRGARIIHVGMAPNLPGILSLWVQVDTRYTDEECSVFILGTGHPMPETPMQLRHAGTVVSAPFVWHVYQPALS